MKKEEVIKHKTLTGKNLLKCSSCSCNSESCNDAAYFCANCGIWRIVLALILLVGMYKIGFMVGAEMANSMYADDMSASSNHMMVKRHNKSGMMMRDKVLDSNGCKVSEAAVWSKAEAKCVKLYEEATVLTAVNGDALLASYVMLSDDKNKLELFYAGSRDGIIVSKKDNNWVSDDGKYIVSKSIVGKYVLSVSGRVVQAQMR